MRRIEDVAGAGIGGDARGVRGWVVSEPMEDMGGRGTDLFYMEGEGRQMLLRLVGVDGKVAVLEHREGRRERERGGQSEEEGDT